MVKNKIGKNQFSLFMLLVVLFGCSVANETIEEAYIVIRPLGNDFEGYEKEDLHHYYISDEAIETVYTPLFEEPFSHEADLLHFERTETGFDFIYINYFDEKIDKSFEIKSSSIVSDEKGIWHEWGGPEDWHLLSKSLYKKRGKANEESQCFSINRISIHVFKRQSIFN